MNYDLDYLYYVLSCFVFNGSMSYQKADEIYLNAQTTGIMPEFDYIPYSEQECMYVRYIFWQF